MLRNYFAGGAKSTCYLTHSLNTNTNRRITALKKQKLMHCGMQPALSKPDHLRRVNKNPYRVPKTP